MNGRWKGIIVTPVFILKLFMKWKDVNKKKLRVVDFKETQVFNSNSEIDIISLHSILRSLKYNHWFHF